MTTNLARKVLFAGVCVSVLGVANAFALPEASAQVTLSQCDQIEDRERRRRCRDGVYDSKRYAEEAQGWRDEEARIRADHERACRRVGMVARFVGQGRTFRAACEAPRRINDARR